MPSPRRRQSHTLQSWLSSIFILFLIPSIIPPTSAHNIELDNSVYDSSLFQSLADLGQIHVDTRPPPPLPSQTLYHSSSSSATLPVTILSPRSPATTANAVLSPSQTSLETDSTSTSLSIVTTASATVVASPLPSPFDTSLGSNFTSSSCPTFFSTFLSNSTFRTCLPISLLLQNSASFFRAERSATLLTETLDSSCSASLAICSPLLTSLAQDLITSSNCGDDYSLQNPLVVQAYNGLIAYEAVYRATCLKNPATSGYCFVEAIVGTSNGSTTGTSSGQDGDTGLPNPEDSYPYYTALGLNMINGSRPDCSPCLQHTMGIFQQYAAEDGQPLALTYLPCAEAVNQGCGVGWASTDVKAGSVQAQAKSSGAGRGVGRGEGRWVVGIVIGLVGIVVML